MLAAVSSPGTICASCRLHGLLRAKQLSRSRKLCLQSISRSFHLQKPQYQDNTTAAPLGQAPDCTDAQKYTKTGNEEDALDEEHHDVDFDTLNQEPERSDLSPEAKALRVRQKYRDVLPEGILNDREYDAYERMYGKPLPPVEDERPAGIEEASEHEIQEQSGVKVLRQNGDGQYEEIKLDPEDVGEDSITHHSLDDTRLSLDIESSMHSDSTDQQIGEDLHSTTMRSHPFTRLNRFGTSPSTIQLPKDSLVLPVTYLLSGMPRVHLQEAAHRIFGGIGLPYSASTPASGRMLQPKPIALLASQSSMTEIEGDSFLSVLYPAIFATIVNVLVETRKRLGTAWGENLVRKAEAGTLRILDAGGGGAGVLAVREVIRAEWERMHKTGSNPDSTTTLAAADGRAGGVGASPPPGSATVLTGSSALRTRASQLLENTTFIPRLPDYVHTENAKERGKFDIIVAPNTLWPFQEDYLRKVHVQNMWSLLSNDGGVLIMTEKGTPRGFELVAGAREMLLNSRLSSPKSESNNRSTEERPNGEIEWEDGERESLDHKDKGMIIAPCTNHETCPMFKESGMNKGRKDTCSFQQRYIRPAFLQNILGAKDKNHEDIQFSYLSVMRGRDLRRLSDAGELGDEPVLQDEQATRRAFAGFEDGVNPNDQQATFSPLLSVEEFFYQSEGEGEDSKLGNPPQSLSLPRAILPPIKRKGHVILDLCTPSGTLERWTVPRSFSKQAFRDARKSQWGDLWALGAKTRIPRSIRTGQFPSKDQVLDVKGRVKSQRAVATGGQKRGQKVKGIRDKRDKKADGRGRRKQQNEQS